MLHMYNIYRRNCIKQIKEDLYSGIVSGICPINESSQDYVIYYLPPTCLLNQILKLGTLLENFEEFKICCLKRYTSHYDDCFIREEIWFS